MTGKSVGNLDTEEMQNCCQVAGDCGLKNEFNLFRAVNESSPDALLVVSLEGVIRIANSATTRLFGHPLSDIVGQDISMLMPADMRDRHREYLRAYDPNSESPVVGEIREVQAVRRDGSIVPVDIHIGRAVLDGMPVLTAVIRDATSRKRLDMEREMHFAAVREKVETLTAELRRQAEQLEEELGAALTKLTRRVASRTVLPDLGDLSARESEVLALILQGGNAQAVAGRLYISPHTVRNHVKKIYHKLDVHSHGDLLRKCGIGPPAQHALPPRDQ